LRALHVQIVYFRRKKREKILVFSASEVEKEKKLCKMCVMNLHRARNEEKNKKFLFVNESGGREFACMHSEKRRKTCSGKNRISAEKTFSCKGVITFQIKRA
jgi:hypothetical protein